MVIASLELQSTVIIFTLENNARRGLTAWHNGPPSFSEKVNMYRLLSIYATVALQILASLLELVLVSKSKCYSICMYVYARLILLSEDGKFMMIVCRRSRKSEKKGNNNISVCSLIYNLHSKLCTGESMEHSRIILWKTCC